VSLGYYMDEHFPVAITNGLRRRGVDVLTAQEDGRDSAPDSELLDRATTLRRVFVTSDTDLLREAAARHQAGKEFTGIAFIQQFAISIGDSVRDLEVLAGACDFDELLNKVEYLPYQ
jgi:hypothetical protein